MICPHCGENNPDNAKYCTRCSATLHRKSRPASGKGASSGSSFDPKIIIIIILALVVVIGGIALIRSGSDDKKEDTSEEASTEEKTEEETEEKTEESTEEASAEEEDSTTDWFDEHELGLSANESFTFKTMMNDGEDDTDEMEVTSKVTITESTENAPDGYKMVKATFIHNVSESDGERGIIADGAFDRYTGTYFGFEDEQPEQDDDNKADMDDFVRITNGSKHYDIAIKTDQKTEQPIITKNITVICPKDYDGVIFFAGYDSLDLDKDLKKLDPAEKLYTFDELPFMDDDHECYYFAYSKDCTGRSSWGSYEVTEVEEVSEESQDSGPQRR